MRRLTLIAACVIAFGAGSSGAWAAPEAGDDLWVDAWLAGCATAEHGASCRIDVRHGLVAKAVSYTIRVIGPEGQVRGFGTAEHGSATAWVEYAGSGTYRVEVWAWGQEGAIGRSSAR